ncbi:hypothetical protein [Methanobrevibacter curvatus]|uniref:Uncharacterized protein n=1 Tax=Methanobrevibacter curvatus TaxID=49547 RepID=A0A166AIS7_9EURY|nr:hypothetical protein [Methanobrevibacter curvatus]KZX12083.1 hypothetical protein MBCUR_11860 [Methanobrevibacter curvatus]
MGIFKEESKERSSKKKYSKERYSKERLIFFALISFFALFLILSFSSINTVYGLDSDNILPIGTDISLTNDSNTETLFFTDNLYFYNESIQNTNLNGTENLKNCNSTINLNISINISTDNHVTINKGISSYYNGSHKSDHILITSSASSNSQIDYVTNYEQFDSNFNTNLNNNFYFQIDNAFKGNYLEKENNIGKENSIKNENNTEKKNNIGKKSINIENINYNSFYSILQYYSSNFNNYYDYYNYINLYVKHTTISLTSSDFKGTPLLKFNNFIKEISNLNFTKIDEDKQNIIIHDSSTSFKPTLTILFFIKIFMEHHDNGKEHLISF